jgi:hypothetical protein
MHVMGSLQTDLYADDMDMFRGRVVASFYEAAGPESTICLQATKYGLSVLPNGTWASVDYHDQGRATWKTFEHLSRLSTVSMGLTMNISKNASEHCAHLAANQTLRVIVGRAMNSSLDWWLMHNPSNPNWWYNQIGVPMNLAQTMLMVQQLVSKDQVAKAAKIISQAKPGMTGANLVWLCKISAWRGLLVKDEGLVNSSISRIWEELKVEAQNGDNIQGSQAKSQSAELRVICWHMFGTFCDDSKLTLVFISTAPSF